MGRPKGHPGPVKPEAEKMNNFYRLSFTANEYARVKARAKELNLSIARYFRTLFVADITKNA